MEERKVNDRKIVITADGSHTIYVPGMDEHYHSVTGAMQESAHIYIRNGFDFCKDDPLFIFEAGFGTGLNALLTAIRSLHGSRKVVYTSVEKYPLEESVIKSLNYELFTGKEGKQLFSLIHDCEWGRMTEICRNFSILKLHADLITDEIHGSYNLIYFDAFGPDKQPEIWTSDIFRKISEITSSKGVFITYSSKGDVKRNLRYFGFEVTLLPGPPGKRHIIRAVKI
ncbi:MAG: tRNA (5-methylaminomethyl-2-thiouridine)(34)-methyltransferase MnmD [Bacteroidota bacterium]